MPEVTNEQSQQTATVPAQAATPATPEAKPHVPTSALPEEALSARLEAAKRTGQSELLKSLGVSDPAQLKSALDALKIAEDAKKTDAEKLAALLAEKQANETRLGEYAKAIDAVWSAESAKLTAEQVAAVTAVAGDDPARRMQILAAFRPTWTATVQPQQASAAPTTVPLPTPATTAPAPTAPTPTVTNSTVDHAAEWGRLKEVNPIAAAHYLEQHSRAIFK